MDQKLNDWIDGQEQEIINSLSELIAIKSVSTDLPKVKEGLDWILALADRLGFQAKSVLDGQIGVVEMGDGSETLGILTHVDVVSPGEPEQFSMVPGRGVKAQAEGRQILAGNRELLEENGIYRRVCDLQSVQAREGDR